MTRSSEWSGLSVNPNSIASPVSDLRKRLRGDEVAVRVRPPIPVELPRLADFLDHVEVEVADEELFLTRIADGRYLGKYRKTHIPHCKPGFWEKFYFRPRNLGYPVFETAFAKVGVYICYDRHFPEGARALGLNGAEMVFIPSATSRGLSMHLWRIEQTSHAIANGYFVGTINRVGKEPMGDNDYYGTSYFCDPRGQFVGEVASDHAEELVVRDLDLDKVEEVRQTWQFYRDRRQDAYGDLVAP